MIKTTTIYRWIHKWLPHINAAMKNIMLLVGILMLSGFAAEVQNSYDAAMSIH